MAVVGTWLRDGATRKIERDDPAGKGPDDDERNRSDAAARFEATVMPIGLDKGLSSASRSDL